MGLVLNKIRAAYACAKGVLTDWLPPDQRVHPEFTHYTEGWFINKQMNDADGFGRYSDSYKVRILFQEDDLSKLNDCPYIAKFCPSAKPGFKYCGFLYPFSNTTQIESVANIAIWAKTQGFPNISIFAYGKTTAMGGWIPGKFAQQLSGDFVP